MEEILLNPLTVVQVAAASMVPYAPLGYGYVFIHIYTYTCTVSR
jgi:hypothetical protein